MVRVEGVTVCTREVISEFHCPQTPEESASYLEGAIQELQNLLTTVLSREVSSANLDSILKVSAYSVCGAINGSVVPSIWTHGTDPLILQSVSEL